MKEYLFVDFLGDVPSEPFRSWPLHVTLVPWVRTDLETMKRIAERVAERNSSFTARVEGDALFGVNENTPVKTLERSPEFSTLHTSLLSHLDEEGVSIRGLRYAAHNFRPHVTIRQKQPYQVPDSFVVDAISVVEKGDAPGERLVCDTYELLADNLGGA